MFKKLQPYKCVISLIPGIKIRPHSSKVKQLPCVTVCALSGFRKRGFYYSTQDYTQNTFELEDFFTEKTLNEIRNNSLYKYKEVRTLFFGRCYKICDVDELPLINFKIWELKLESNYKLIVHNDGDEFWLITAITYATAMTETIFEVNRTDGIKAGFKFFYSTINFCL